MKLVIAGLVAAALLAGCGFNRWQGDISDNQYRKVATHADADAAYVGQWTAATNVGVRSVMIRQDGRAKVCLSPSGGTTDGKVFLDGGTPALIFESGAKARIISMSREYLLLDLYGSEGKYYAGQVEAPCITTFRNFD